MSRSTGNIIADSLELGLGYGERLLKDVTADKFGRLANTGRAPIQSNHGAFIYGHLSLYAPEIIDHLKGDSSSLKPPAAFEFVFSKDATCQDDPDGKIYPAMDEVTKYFFESYRAAVAQLRAADEEVMQAQNPHDGRLGELFPTIGSLVGFYSGGHVMMHMGQMSAWRRMMGMGAA